MAGVGRNAFLAELAVAVVFSALHNGDVTCVEAYDVGLCRRHMRRNGGEGKDTHVDGGCGRFVRIRVPVGRSPEGALAEGSCPS